MGSQHKAHCPCGYENTVYVGGVRRTFLEKSKYPHYCNNCGLVEVNVCKTPLECPSCKSSSILPYGHKKISKYKKKETLVLQLWENSAQMDGNLCPRCKEYTLKFEHPEIVFD
jgi:hypothetical protein